jgi:tetratricopeptide (TPR) repeat protein
MGKTIYSFKFNRRHLLFPVIAVIILVIYLPALKGEFTNWDDRIYVVENQLITHFSIENVLRQFSVFHMGNYHPLTLLSLSLDYLVFGSAPFGFHLTNILLHIINSLLIAVFFRKLTGNYLLAFSTSLLFGLHPMHVESVAWISERKDVLYSMFFLLSLISYIEYFRSKKFLWYLISFSFFIFSCLSKGQAVVLPVAILITILYLEKERVWGKPIYLLIPFFILSIGVGILTIIAQQSAAAIEMVQYPFYQRIIFSAYGLTEYIIKLILPVSLSAYYPYPIKLTDDFPVYLWFYLIPSLVLIFVWIKSYKYLPVVFFGIGFFIVNLFFVLQWLPVGRAVMADRYIYLGSIGFCFILSWAVTHPGLQQFRGIVYILFMLYCMSLSWLTWNRTHVWQNSEVLWSDVISKFPDESMPYFNRGNHYMQLGMNDLALADYTECIAKDAGHWEAYTNRGVVYTKNKQYQKAIDDFDSANSINPGHVKPLINRANAYKELGDYSKALEDYSEVLKMQPDNYSVKAQRASLFIVTGDSALAVKEIGRLNQQTPGNSTTVKLQADLHFQQGQQCEQNGLLEKASEHYKKTVELRPDFPEAWMFLGVVYGKLGKPNDAIFSLSKAILIRSDYAQALATRGVAYASIGKFDLALGDIDKAILLEFNNGLFYFNRALIYLNMRKSQNACSDLKTAINLGYQMAMPVYRKECEKK